MDPKAMEQFGMALLAYQDGDKAVQITFRRDDGVEIPVPAGYFFRSPEDFTPIEKRAVDLCRGRVLDVGAGSGLLSLALQERGLAVTAIDIAPGVVEVMKRRGVKDAQVADFFRCSGGHFDTLLLMGHGIGMVETISGLDRFLGRAAGLLAPGGQVLFDSLDVNVTKDPANLAYHEACRRESRYIGEIRMQVGFRGVFGPYFGWLQVDAETAAGRARSAQWMSEVVEKSDSGDYLCRLTMDSWRTDD